MLPTHKEMVKALQAGDASAHLCPMTGWPLSHGDTGRLLVRLKSKNESENHYAETLVAAQSSLSPGKVLKRNTYKSYHMA